MFFVEYHTSFPFPISDFSFRALLRIPDRLRSLSRIYKIPYYSIPITFSFSRPVPRYVRFLLSLISFFRRFLLLLTYIAIFILSCFLIYLIFRSVLIAF